MPTKVMMPLALLLGTVIVVAPAAAQVPVNDAARTDTETRTRVCMTRARTFKQASVSPSRGVTVSVTSSHDTAGIAVVSGQSVFGATFSGTTIAGSEFQVIAAVVGSIAAIKTDNVGQVLNSLAAVASAIAANQSALKAQSTTIGASSTQQGAFDQNTVTRLSAAQVWNQAIEAVNTRNTMRNQKLLDQAAGESAFSDFMRGKN